MPLASVEIEGLKRLQKALASYPDIARPRLQDAIQGGAAIVQKHATRETVPWRTGNLTQSFGNGITIGELYARVGPTARYAVFVHEGTRYIKTPNRFMPRIAERAAPEVNVLFAKALDRITEDLAKKG